MLMRRAADDAYLGMMLAPAAMTAAGQATERDISRILAMPGECKYRAADFHYRARAASEHRRSRQLDFERRSVARCRPQSRCLESPPISVSRLAY